MINQVKCVVVINAKNRSFISDIVQLMTPLSCLRRRDGLKATTIPITVTLPSPQESSYLDDHISMTIMFWL